MKSMLTIKNLTLKLNDEVFFKDFNLSIPEKSFTSIVAPNQSGKSLLVKLLSAIIPTDDKIIVDNISLNKQNVLTYITKIGVVTNDFNQPFLFKKVKDELAYPLLNLGYPEHKINRVITEIANFFSITDLLNKPINKLSISASKKLLIIVSLIHRPKILILDDAFLEMTTKDQDFMLKKLNELNQEGLTILNITSKLDTIYSSKQVFVLNKFKIIRETTPLELLEDDKFLKELGLELPMVVDLAIKLKFYGLIDKIYFNLDDLEGDLWK